MLLVKGGFCLLNVILETILHKRKKFINLKKYFPN